MDHQRKYFPLFVDLTDKKIVVVGAGTIAKRRIRVLVDFTKNLTLLAPEVNSELVQFEKEGKLTILKKTYEKEDILDASYVFAATKSCKLNQEIYTDCKSLGIPVNVYSNRELCDFFFPVLAYDDSIVAGVSSGGRDSANSRRVADQIRELLNKENSGEDQKGCS